MKKELIDSSSLGRVSSWLFLTADWTDQKGRFSMELVCWENPEEDMESVKKLKKKLSGWGFLVTIISYSRK